MTPYIEQIDPQLEAAARLISSHPTVIDAMPTRKLRFAVDSPMEGTGFELPVPREIGLRRGRRLALHLGSLTLRNPYSRPPLNRKPGSFLTRRWREMDSNFRFRAR